MAIPSKNVLGNPNVTEGNFQIAIEKLRESVIGSGKTYDSANTYMAYDICYYSGVVYYSKIDSNIGNTPSIGSNWGDYTDLLLGVVHKTGNETIAGVKTFSSSPIVPVPALANQVISMGNIIEKTSAVIGYGAGSGCAVTQLTSKSTTVTLNKPSGQITMHNESLPAGGSVFFQVNNSLVSTAGDTVLVGGLWSSSDPINYRIEASRISAGNFTIRVTNIAGVSLSQALFINFAIIKGAVA